MKAEKEIREHMELSREAATPRCYCQDCIGHRQTAGVLRWVLGEGEDLQPAIDRFHDTVVKQRTAKARRKR